MPFYFSSHDLQAHQNAADETEKTGELSDSHIVRGKEFADWPQAKAHYWAETAHGNTYNYDEYGDPRNFFGTPRYMLAANICHLTKPPRLLEVNQTVIDTMASHYGDKLTPASPNTRTEGELRSSLNVSFEVGAGGIDSTGRYNYWLPNFVASNWLEINSLMGGGYDGYKTPQEIGVVPKFVAAHAKQITTRTDMELADAQAKAAGAAKTRSPEPSPVPRSFWQKLGIG